MLNPRSVRFARLGASAALSAALIASAISVPMSASAETTTTSVAAAQAAAATTPLVYNGLEPNTTLVTTSGVQHGVQMVATGLDGTTDSSNLASAITTTDRPISIIEASNLAGLSVVFSYANTNATNSKINVTLILPKYTNGYSLSADANAFDANGLKAEYLPAGITQADLKYAGAKDKLLTWAEYSASYAPTDLLQVRVETTVAAGSSGQVEVPLTLPELSTVDEWSTIEEGQITYGENMYTPYVAKNLINSVRLANLVTATDDVTGRVPFTGKYLPVIDDGDTTDDHQWTLVEELVGVMPKPVVGQNYWVNNFGEPDRYVDSEETLYTQSYYNVDRATIDNAVNSYGYDTAAFNGSFDSDFEYYAASSSDNADIDAGDSGVNVDPTVGNTAPYVMLRIVVASEDASVVEGDSYTLLDELGVAVYDHDAAEVALDSADVTVSILDADGNAVDLADADSLPVGTYSVTVGYTPDGVTRTMAFEVTAEVPVATEEPSSEVPSTEEPSATADEAAAAEDVDGAAITTGGDVADANAMWGLGAAAVMLGAGATAVARRRRS